MNFNKIIHILNKTITPTSPTFIIAEAGVNHGGDLRIAKELIDIAAEAGADAVKFQAFITEELILRSVEKAPYQKETTNVLEPQFDMLKKLEISIEDNQELKRYCEKKNIIFLTTPFDEVSLDKLDKLNLPAYKIASSDTTNLPFLKKIAKKGKPIFLSTGMSYLSEVRLALETIYAFNKNVILLQCTANYPIDDTEANLAVINTFKSEFDIIVGYSDHTVGVGAAPYAIPMGAKIVEKHFTIDKTLEGPDHRASLSPDELKAFVQDVRRVDTYMGSTIKAPISSEINTRASLQKYLVAKKEIAKGEIFTEDNTIAKRTGGKGISPIHIKDVYGQKAPHIFQKDDIIKL